MSCLPSTASTEPAAICLRASGCPWVAACPAREGAAVAALRLTQKYSIDDTIVRWILQSRPSHFPKRQKSKETSHDPVGRNRPRASPLIRSCGHDHRRSAVWLEQFGRGTTREAKDPGCERL